MKGQRVLLVGGSGGLGGACTKLLASEGAKLTITYCHSQAKAEALSDIAQVVQADITLANDRERLAELDVDGVIVFAGTPARVTAKGDVEQKMIDSHAINYMGPILLARLVAEQMKERGRAGAIVLFSTMQSIALFPGSTVYAGAKAALIHSARILAKEMRSANIRVNVVAPGVIQAGMAEASIASGKYDRYLHDGTIPRFGSADDIARAVRFLLEPDNYITGQVLSVDGGITL